MFTLEAFDYYYAEYYSEAEEKFKLAIADNSNNAVAWKGYHMALAKVGKDSDARNAIQRSLDINPNDPESWFCLAIFLDEHNLETSTALDAYRHGLALEPSEGEMWRNLAILYKKSGNLIKAEEVMREVLEYWPDDISHLRVLEWILQHQSRVSEAEEIKTRIEALNAEEKQRHEDFDREVSETVKEIMGFDIDDDDDEDEAPEPYELDHITKVYEEGLEEEESESEDDCPLRPNPSKANIFGMDDDDFENTPELKGGLFSDDEEDSE